MNSGTLLGKASISFSRPVYIQSCASVVGPKEGDGPLKNCFDMICDDHQITDFKSGISTTTGIGYKQCFNS